MKVVHLHTPNRMSDTHLGFTGSFKKIQNYVFDMGNVLGVGNFSKVYRGVNQLTSSPFSIQTRSAPSRW